jgi:non-specific serine/threonine protein kinase/serine/threonine-protein kinase
MELPEHYHRAQSLFHAAAELDRVGRERLLAEECAREPELRAYVERLLAAHDRATRLLSDVGETMAAEPEPLRTDDRVGPYRVIERLGEGGMGVVYLAEQREPFRRQVALKVVKAGMDSRAILTRFEAERQALALMEHPNIARVLDAGTTENARPFFAMELVHGEPITVYCDRHELSNRERIALFVHVCHAVQHAHQKGVIHRDLKPSNILVTLQDGRPVPKIIDFGIAKAVSAPLTERTVHTHLGQILGTAEYMSPEQAEMGALDVDTRSDIYSLGTVLYELLTGSLPLSRETLRAAGYAEIQRIIREVEPPRPSTRVSTLGASAGDLAKKRHTDVRRLTRELQRDLDWVLMRTLEKDRTRRYETASDVAAELERFLRDEPVLAGPPSVVYRARKLAARHKAGVAIAASALAAIVVSGVALTWALVDSNRNRRELATALEGATLAQDETDAVQRFMARMFEMIRPENQGADVRVREMLDSASVRVDREFAEHPLVAARTHYLLGELFEYVGAWRESRDHYAKCLEIRRRILGNEDRATLEAWKDWAEMLLWVGGPGTGQKSLQELGDALALAERRFGEEDTLTLDVMVSVGGAMTYQDRRDEAEKVLRRALRVATSMRPPRRDLECLVYNQLAIAVSGQGRHREAMALRRAEIAAATELYGARHPTTLTALHNLACSYRDLGDFAAAESLFAVYLERIEGLFGPESQQPGTAYANLAGLHRLKGDLQQELFWTEKTAQWREAQNGGDAPNTLYYMSAAASLRCKLEGGRESIVRIEGNLDRLARLEGIDEAAREHWRVSILVCYAEALAAVGEDARAERAYLEAYDTRRRRGPAGTKDVAEKLVAFFERIGKPTEAARVREEQAALQGP